MPAVALALAEWAAALRPSPEDEALARAALLDTVAVALAGREHPAARLAAVLTEPGRWAALSHVLDFDDLHLPSTAHLSAVCVPATLTCGGGAREYLGAAGVMARLGTALGWDHYTRGWHATTTAGAPAAAAGAALARGLDAERVAVAMALAVPAAGGVQRAFGTDAKSLQVGFAVEAGLRAAALADAGARADTSAMDQWLALLGGDAERLELDGPAVPGGLAVKLHPCCYALQRPIAAARLVRAELGGNVSKIDRVHVRTTESSVRPLIHDIPATGLEAKFSLRYGVAVGLLDEVPGFGSFDDAGAHRPALRELAGRVEVELVPGGDGLLAGSVELAVRAGGETWTAELETPPGAPGRPATDDQLREKLALCAGPQAAEAGAVTWETAPALLRRPRRGT